MFPLRLRHYDSNAQTQARPGARGERMSVSAQRVVQDIHKTILSQWLQNILNSPRCQSLRYRQKRRNRLKNRVRHLINRRNNDTTHKRHTTRETAKRVTNINKRTNQYAEAIPNA